MSGLSKRHEKDIKAFTDEIINLVGIHLMLMDDPDEIISPDTIRHTLTQIRNNAMLIEDYIERASESRS